MTSCQIPEQANHVAVSAKSGPSTTCTSCTDLVRQNEMFT